VLSYLRSFGDQYIEAVVLAKKFQKPKRQQIENDVKQLVGKQFKREELWNVKQKANNSILESLGELSKNNNNRARYIVATDDVRLRRKIIKCYADTPTLTVVKDKIAIDYPTKEFHEAIKKHEQATMAKLSELSPWEREEMARILGTPTESAPSAAAEESDSNDEDEQDDIIDDEVDDDDDDDVSEPVTKRARK
jgi:rRNA-processing protein FCF1